MPDGAGVTLSPGYSAFGALRDATKYGGDCLPMISGAALNVGDAVYQSAANTVSKGVTANNALRVGVVVSGFKSGFRCYPEIKFGGVACDAAGQVVLVCFSGKVRALSDGAVAVGDKLGFGGTAGRLQTLATATGVVMGIALSATGGAAVEFDALVMPS